MQKPLSVKSLEKKYAQLGLSEAKLQTLHRYFNAFAHLYGCLEIEGAWEIFKHYEGAATVRKKDFVAFAGVAQRQADLAYYVADINEIYSAEKPEPENRLLVHKDLISIGYGKYHRVYRLEHGRADFPPYLPPKQELLSFVQDPFYATEPGKAFAGYISALRCCGKGREKDGKEYRLTDCDGQSVKGKRLDSITVITREEQFDLDYYAKAASYPALLQKFRRPAAEKILKKVKNFILEGLGEPYFSPIEQLFQLLSEDYGAVYDMRQAQEIIQLYTRLNNTSNLWCRFGWSPEQLVRASGRQKVSSLSIGSNMQKMLQTGEVDIEELRRACQQHGIELIE